MSKIERLTFGKELEQLINRHSQENASNTPDFILLEYMKKCLDAYNTATQQREAWYGRDARPTNKDTLNNLTEDKGDKCITCAGSGSEWFNGQLITCTDCNGSGVRGVEERYSVCQHLTCKMLTDGDKFCDEHKPKPKSLEDVIEEFDEHNCWGEFKKELCDAIRTFIKQIAEGMKKDKDWCCRKTLVDLVERI